MRRLPRTLKVLGGVVGIVTALDIIVVAAWAAGAPTAVVIPILLGSYSVQRPSRNDAGGCRDSDGS